MTKVLFWELGALARDGRLQDGAREALDALAAKGWRHVLLAKETADVASACDALGLSANFEKAFGADAVGSGRIDKQTFKRVFEAIVPFEQAFFVGASLADALAADEAGVPTILAGAAAPQASFCVQTLDEIPLALETWASMRRSFVLEALKDGERE